MKTTAKNSKSTRSTRTNGKSTKAKVDKKNVETTEQVITVQKSTKWIYPEGCKTPLERKAFRQQVKNKIRTFERQINSGQVKGKKLTTKELKDLEKKLIAFKNKVINPNYRPAKNWVDDLVD